MEQKILELIPINHESSDSKEIPAIHLARLVQKALNDETVDEIIYIIFNEEEDRKIIEILKGMHELFFNKEPKEELLSLEYPNIIRGVRNLRRRLERDYNGWSLFLNLTPLRHHFHSIILRDGLKSDSYELLPYEIYNPDYKKFDFAIIPDYRELDLADYEIIDLLFTRENKPMSLKMFISDLDAPEWNKEISTYDQKVRKRLNFLVDRGLLSYKRGPNGEKFYKLKYFRLDSTY